MSRFLFFVIFALILPSPLLSKPPSLFEAITAFEEGDDVRARKLFRPFLRGTPIARPYCEFLMPEELPPQENICRGKKNPYEEDLRQWYEVSLLSRTLNEIEKNEEASEKKNRPYKKLIQLFAEKKSPAAGYATAQIAERLKNKEERDEADELYLMNFIVSNNAINKNKFRAALNRSPELKEQKLMQTIQEALSCGMQFGKYMTESVFFDPRSLISIIGKTKQLRVGAKDADPVDLVPIAKILKKQFELKTESESLFGLAEIFYKTHNPLTKHFLAMAAALGCPHAQRVFSQIVLNEHQKLFWISQSCEKEEFWALTEAVCATPADPTNAYIYLHRLLSLGDYKQAQTYISGKLEENQFDDVSSFFNFILKDYETLDFENMVYLIMSFLPKMPEESIAKFAQKFFAFLEKRKNGISYVLRGSVLVNYNSDNSIVDAEFGGDPLKHFEIAESEGIARAAYQIGVIYEQEEKAEEALAAYERSISKGDTFALHNAGRLLMDKRDSELDIKALKYLREAYDIVPEFKAVTAYNLAIMHMYGRGGAEQDYRIIREYVKVACEDASFKDDAYFEFGLYCIEQKLPFAMSYLNEAAQNDHPEALLYAGQLLLFNDPNKKIEHRQQGYNYIKKAFDLNAPGAKPIYAFLHLTGIAGVLEPNKKIVSELVDSFTPKESAFYFQALKRFKGSLTAHPEKEVVLLEKEEEEGTSISHPWKETALPPTSEKDITKKHLAESTEKKFPEIAEKAPLSPYEKKIERLQIEIEELMSKKQVKWRKVQKLMGQMINLTSGSFRPATGGGSGHKGKIGNTPIHLHIAHGKGHNPTMLTGGRLDSMVKALRDASHEAAEKPAAIAEKKATAAAQKKRGKRKKGKRKMRRRY